MPHTYELKMHTDLVQLDQLFDYEGEEHNFGFDIPSIQRDFSWLPGVEGDETKNDSSYRLIQDLLDFHYRDSEGNDTYFLGTVILFKQEGFDRLQIMDGQQRLTALVSLMSMLRYILLKSGADNIRVDLGNGNFDEQSAFEWSEEIRVSFLEYGGQPSITPKSKADQKTIKEMLSLKGWMDPRDHDHFTPGAGSSNSRVSARGSPLYLTSLLFLDRLREAADENQDGEISPHELSELLRFYNTMRYRVAVNRTTTDDIGLAYRMFVTANTRGMPLNNFDIFRGLIIARTYQLGFEESLASQLETHLEVTSMILDAKYGIFDGDVKYNQDNKSSLIDKIMAASSSVRMGRRIAEKNVSSHFENEISSMSTFEELEELVKFTMEYSSKWDTLSPKRTTESKLLSLEYRIHRRFQRLGLQQHIPFVTLMQVKGWTGSQLADLLWQIECFVMRVQIAAGMGTAKHLYALMRFAKEIYEGKSADEVTNNISNHLRKICDRLNPEGWEHLKNRQFNKDKTAFALLHAILPGQRLHDPGPSVQANSRYASPKARKLLPNYSYDYRTKGWQFPRAEMISPGRNSNRIGNWFLVDGTLKELNRIDSFSPSVKIDEFSEKGGSETRSALRLRQTWEAADIDVRIKRLITAAEEKYPSSFQKP